jgi:hypothetical protein
MNVTKPCAVGITEVRIRVIPHGEQRYPTVGDWKFGIDGALEILVSDLGDWRLGVCCAVHELTEAVLAIQRGVSQKAIDEFDIAFEKKYEKQDVPAGFSPSTKNGWRKGHGVRVGRRPRRGAT